MKIMLINPNTTASFSEMNLAIARAVASPGTEFIVSHPLQGAPSVEGHLDEAVATIGILEAVRGGETQGVDGYVLACFGDCGVHAARELARGPVVGMSEAAMHVAGMLAPSFSIVTLPPRTKMHSERVVRECGFDRQCRSVRAIELPVLELDGMSHASFAALLSECRGAIHEDGAEAIILGCAGMADLVPRLSAELGVPVIDGVGAAVKMVESLIALRLSTSKINSYAFPGRKVYDGMLAHLSPSGGPV